MQPDTTCLNHKIVLIYRERRETALPEIATPLSEIDVSRISAVGFAKGGAQAVFISRRQGKTNVVGYQTIGPHR